MAKMGRERRAAVYLAARVAAAVDRRRDVGPAPDLETVPGRAAVLLADLDRAWPPDRVDPRGGFLVQPRGRDAEPPPVWRTIAQARVTWFHAACAATRPDPAHAAAASHGVRLLRERLWDAEHGGFVFELDPDGPDTDDSKHLYTNAFGLFAVAQTAKASNAASDLAFADEIFDVIDERWRPNDPDGRPEVLDRGWTPPAEPGPLTLDAWLHLLEACTVMAEVSTRPAVHAALGSLVELVGERLARHPCGTCPDDFGPGWRDLPPTHHTVSYGHEFERISLVLRAVDALGEDPGAFVERFTHLAAHLALVAVDRRRGGIFYRGAPCRLAWHRQKFWWVQAEALYACHALHRRRPSVLNAQLLDGTLGWVERYQHDPVTGDWHAAVLRTVPHDTPIAGPWKTPYHIGRALLALTDQLS